MTQLKEYIDQEDITVVDLSKIFKRSRVHMSNIVHGKSRAGPKLAKRIEKWSDGKVDANYLVFPERYKPK